MKCHCLKCDPDNKGEWGAARRILHIEPLKNSWNIPDEFRFINCLDELGAVNTLARFALGSYGTECKPEFIERHPAYYHSGTVLS